MSCVDHWHCDPREAAHMCSRPDRTAPCPTCGAILVTDNDLHRLEQLTLDPHAVNALAKRVGIHLETVNPERTNWYATPKGRETFSGTFPEVSAFVRGFASAHVSLKGSLS